jgi:tRNA(adenine34) deaminase
MEAGSLGSLLHVGADPRLNHEFPVTGGVQAEACTALLDTFFNQLRQP